MGGNGYGRWGLGLGAAVCLLAAVCWAQSTEQAGNPSSQEPSAASAGQQQNPSRPVAPPVTVNVYGTVRDDYLAPTTNLAGFDSLPIQNAPVSAFVVTRTLLDDQQARSLTDVVKNEASVGEDYAPVGWYGGFEIRGFPIDLATGIKINGLTIAGEQLVPLENKERVEFLNGLAGVEAGVASPGGLINFVTKRPAIVHRLDLATDHRGTAYGSLDLGGFSGSRQQFGFRVNVAGEDIHSYVNGANGTRGMGAFAGDWKIDDATVLKGDFEYQHLVQHSVSGYQLLGGTTIPKNVYPSNMLGYQPWTKPNTFDAFNISIRLDHTFSRHWKGYIAAGRSYSLIDDNVAWAYGCYYEPSCDPTIPGSSPPYFFSTTGDYDVYDYRSPGERRIDDHFEAILSGEKKFGPFANNITLGASLFRRLVSMSLYDPSINPDYTGVVDEYIGTENLYHPLQPLSPSSVTAGPRLLNENSRQSALIVADRVHLPGRIELGVGGQFVGLRDHNFTQPVPPGPYPLVTDKNVWLPRYSVLFRARENLSVFVTYSVALSLGLQAPFWTTNGSEFLAPFFTRQIEAGAKYELKRRLLLTATAFRARSPFFYPKVVDNAGDLTFLSEGRETHTGLELSAQGKISKWLNISASAAAIHAVSDDTGTPQFNGKQVLNVPRFRHSIFADIAMPHVRGFHLLSGWSYTGQKAATRDDTVNVPGYNLFSLGARYTPGGEMGRLTFRLYADNVTDKRYWKDTGTSYGDSFLHLGAPTTVRLSCEYNF